MLPDDDLAAWLRLLGTPGIGREAARRLLAAFGSAAAVFCAGRAAWEAVGGPALADALASPPDDLPARLVAVERWLTGDDPPGVPRQLLRLDDPRYPRRLLETADPPLLLYAQGDLGLLEREALAIVGSRQPTPQGLETARALARVLAGEGLVIVSGMALGIDGAGHQGALDAGGATIAVVGTGLDQAYPARHRALARQIARQGLLLSEFPPGTPPLAGNFPQRNRIIAGLSAGTLVVEAAPASGSMITARLAAEAGREVFAVPGSIHALQSRGCHALIRQGAALVETADDVLAALRLPARAHMATRRSLAGAAAPGADPALLDALGHGPVSLDTLSARTGLGAAALGAALLELELAGHVARLPGQLFQRVGLA